MLNSTPWAEKAGMGNGLKAAIRHFRKGRRLSQEECGERAGMRSPGRNWSNLERLHGRATALSLWELDTVADIVGVRFQDLRKKALELEPGRQ